MSPRVWLSMSALFGAAGLFGCSSIGSLVGCTFVDGQVMESAASELLSRKGTLSPDRGGQAKAKLDIAIVDTECTIFEGEIAYGVDAVCITFEVLIVEE